LHRILHRARRAALPALLVAAAAAGAEYTHDNRLWLEAKTCYAVTDDALWWRRSRALADEIEEADRETASDTFADAEARFETEIDRWSTLELMQLQRLCEERAAAFADD
jgi:hypothetical protein